MKRLLAKLPRSSSGSRELSARSSAAALPADILEVSITEAAAFPGAGTPVSALICSGGASSGVFIEFRSFLCVPAEQIGRHKLVTLCGPLVQPIHFGDEFFQSKVICEPERSAAERREAGPHHHPK